MKTENDSQWKTPPRFARILRKLFPRDLQEDMMDALIARYESAPKFVQQAAVASVDGFRVQIGNAFNKVALLAELSAVIFCFAAAPLSISLIVILGLVLGVLIFRSGYAYPSNPVQGPGLRYYADSLIDAAAAAVVLLLSQCLVLLISPSQAIPSPVLFRSGLTFLPLIATLRLLLRPKPGKNTPFEGSNMSVDAVFKATWGLNIMWFTACFGILVSNPSIVPAYIPEHNILLALSALVAFAVWVHLQIDVLAFHNNTESVLTDLVKKKLERRAETLFKPFDKKDPLYRVHKILEVLCFFLVSAPLVIGVWAWLYQKDAAVDLFRLGFNLVTLWTLVLSWDYVKNANYAAGRFLQQEIAARKALTAPMRS